MKYLLLLLCLLAGCSTPRAGATIKSQTYVLPIRLDHGINTAGDVFALIETIDGVPVLEATGAVTTYSTTFADIAIDGALLESGTNTHNIGFTIPALDSYYSYSIRFCENATPALATVVADTIAGPFLYDPKTNKVFTDTNPHKNLKVRSINE